MLWTIFIILLILWLLGFSLHVGGTPIHLLLVIAVVVLVIQPDQWPSHRLILGRISPLKVVPTK